jgi:hypothetical protein
MRRIPRAVARSFPLVIVVALVGCGSSSTLSASSARYASSSPEYLLAVIDLNKPTATDAQVTPYATALDSLQRDCTNSRVQLADYATTLHQHFPHASALHILDIALGAAGQAISKGAHRSNCEEAFAVAGVAVARGV